jgi:hypothetical protein
MDTGFWLNVRICGLAAAETGGSALRAFLPMATPCQKERMQCGIQLFLLFKIFRRNHLSLQHENIYSARSV